MLLSTGWANVMINALGLAVAIAANRLFRILARILVVWYQARHPAPSANTAVALQGGHSLIAVARETTAPESFGWHIFRQTIVDFRLFPGAVSIGNPATQRRCSFRCSGLATAATLAFLFYAGAQVCALFMALLQVGNVALSNHPDCGLYEFNATRDPEVLKDTDPFEFEIEEASGVWAKNCYGAADKTDGCNQFVYQQIPYNVTSTSCPWSDGMCHADGDSAVRFTTGAVDARRIGVNTPTKLEFNRTTVCSPLNMNETFIEPYSRNGCSYTWHYHYGTSESFGNASWWSRRWGDVGDVPTYLVK